VVAYVNTDVLTKSKSDYVCTSRNAGEVMRHAARANPGRRILFLPDKFLGAVAVSQAQADPDLQDLAQRVDLYDGACHVHARIGERALDEACDRYPDADLLIHPECGCASSCLARTLRGDLRHRHAYFFSTEQMLWHARTSPVREFIVATEAGMVYRLRREIPGKVFWPVSYQAVCEYMKMNTLDKLRESLEHDRVEIRIDPAIREGARAAIDRMLSIQ
jgi:quinolinate synthase